MNEETLSIASRSIGEYVDVPVIITEDPFDQGRLRVFSTFAVPCIIDIYLRGALPSGVSWEHNNPKDLFRDFVLTSQDALKVIKIARMWRNLARAGIAVSLGLAIALITVIHMSGIIK